jgi:heme exporter protein B
MSNTGLSTALLALIQRDLKLAYRHRGALAYPLLFFVIVTSLFPLAVGPSPEVLRTIGPGVIWVSSLLATLLGLETLFRSDYEDGSLEQIILSPHSIPALLFAKVVTHWLLAGLPLLILSPLLAFMMHIDVSTLKTLCLSLLLGTPTLSLIGAVGAALTVSLQRGGLLLTLLVLPLYVPVLIFGANAVHSAANGLAVLGQLYMLGAMLALSIVLVPIAIAAALRASLN